MLDLVAAEGASVLTTGEVGRAMADDMEAHGGLVTHRDLAEYTPLVRPPVRRTVGDWDLAVNPPPSVGGPMLAVMLGELGRRGDWHWPDVLEIQRAVLGYRRFRSTTSATDLDAAGHELLLSVDRHGLTGLPTSSSTANVSVVDADGTACAVTVSSGYGAGITVPGTGMLLNNALGEPELNRLGLHRLVPGIRLASNMAPTTGRTRDGRVLAIGSPGADRITTALMQVLGQGCLHGADLGTPSRRRGCTCGSTTTARRSSSTRPTRPSRAPSRAGLPVPTTGCSRCSSVVWGRRTGARTGSWRRPGTPGARRPWRSSTSERSRRVGGRWRAARRRSPEGAW